MQNDGGAHGYSTAARRLRSMLRVRVRLVRARSPQEYRTDELMLRTFSDNKVH